MSERVHISEIGTFDPKDLPHLPSSWRAVNRHRYVNRSGKINETYDLVDEDGVVVGCGVSTNMEAGE